MAKKSQSANTIKLKQKKDSVVLPNRLLATAIMFLNILLHGEEAKARNRVIELLQPENIRFEEERKAALEPHKVIKDGKPEIEIHPDGSTHFKTKDPTAWIAEWETLKNTPVIFDILPSNRQYWKLAHEIINRTKIDMDFELTAAWEEILAATKNI